MRNTHRESPDLCPTGQITESPVQPPSQKYSGSLLSQITSTSSPSRPTHEGRFAIVTNVGQGMRWTRVALLTRAHPCGRRSRVVLTPRRWRQASRKYPRGDGGKQARSPGRARNKPLKPSRREGRVIPVNLWWLTRVLFYFAREAAGATGTRLSLRPLFSEGTGSCITRAFRAAGTRRCVPTSSSRRTPRPITTGLCVARKSSNSILQR